MTKKDTQVHPLAAGETPGPFEITLHCTDGGSDKIYRIAITPMGNLFTVHYANGRRGGTLASGNKTNTPVDWPEARKIANRLLAEKIAKGYHPIAGSAFAGRMVGVVARPADTGIRPQLLNPIAGEDLERLLKDDDSIAQPKHDGERRLVLVKGGVVTGINRRGLAVGLSPVIAEAVAAMKADLLIDGEQIGDTLHVFDLLELGGIDLRGEPLGFRLGKLLKLASQVALPVQEGATLRLVETAWGEREKRALLSRITQEGGEGIVFKRIDSPYTPGRPNSGGPQLKHKLHDSLSAIVAAVNARRSIAIALIDNRGDHLKAGNVTIPPNYVIPAVGAVVEVRYLYAYDGGALYQPVYQGIRSDIEASECLASQRKFKPSSAA